MQAIEKKRDRGPRNGVDTPTLFATLDAVKNQPDLAKFQFRVSNRWIKGTNSRSRMEPFTGAGGEHAHKGDYSYDADHPAVLVGGDAAPTPVEFLLHGLAGCITAGIANIAAARGVTLTEVTSRIEGDIDLLGLLGLSKEVRNGYQRIHATFDIKGDAPPEKLREIVEQSRARSAVFDVLTNGVPVEMSVNAA
ncbi:MAG TPA: OsmC family protein [Thermoanaerobaculia bacterium]|nr:OsmC family protein [Thermoanaerobaculia bacterium]